MHRYFAVFAITLSAALPLTANAEITKAQYDDAHAKAVAAREQAGEAGNQWTTTEDALEAAEKAAKDGDYDQANALAERAQALAQLAVEQAKNNDESWRKAVPE